MVALLSRQQRTAARVSVFRQWALRRRLPVVFFFCASLYFSPSSPPPSYTSSSLSFPSFPSSAYPPSVSAAAPLLWLQDKEHPGSPAALHVEATSCRHWLPITTAATPPADQSISLEPVAAAAAVYQRRAAEGALPAASSAAALQTRMRAAPPAAGARRPVIIAAIATAVKRRSCLQTAIACGTAAASEGCRIASLRAAAAVAARRCALHAKPAAAAAILPGAVALPILVVTTAARGGPSSISRHAGRPAAAGVAGAQLCWHATYSAALLGDGKFSGNVAPGSSSVRAARRLLYLPGGALLLRILCSTAAAAVSRQGLREAHVKHAAASGIPAAPPATSLNLQHAELPRHCTCCGGSQEEGKLERRKAFLPVLSDSRSCFISTRGTGVLSSMSDSSKPVAATRSPLAAAAATALLKCRETWDGTSSLLTPCRSELSRCFSCCCCCTSFFVDSSYPSFFSPLPASTSPAFYSASRFSPPSQVLPVLRCRRRASSKLSSPRYVSLPRAAACITSSGFTAGKQSGHCLVCSIRNNKGAASLLGDTLASHIRSNVGAISQIVGSRTGRIVKWVLRQFPRLFDGAPLHRSLAGCGKVVDIVRQNIHKQLRVPITRRFDDTLQIVVTCCTSLFASSRAFALMAEQMRSCWIPAAMEAAAECAAAAAAFWGTCAASLLLQKNIGVSCAAKSCKLFGVATVFAASNAAASAASTLRYIIEVLHKRPETGNAIAKLQLPFLVGGKLQNYTTEVQPVHDPTANQLYKSISTLSQQQASAARLHSSVGVKAAEAAGAAQHLRPPPAGTTPQHQQQSGLVAGISLQEAGRVGDQHEGLATGGTAGDCLDRLHMVGAGVNYWSLSSLAEVLRACGASPEALHACVKEGILGCVVFWLLGGRFFRLSPSSLLAPGAYHQHHLSLRAGVDYASLEERRFIKKLGETFGCHTCGRRRGVEEWVADHQPPKSVVVRFNQTWLGWLYGSLRKSFGGTRYLPQRFYPQCKACSSKQATVVKHNAARTRKDDLIINWSSLRTYHLTGGVLQFLRLLAGW